MVKACVRCGMAVSGDYDPKYVCTDCSEFAPILLTVWEEADEQMRSSDSIDPAKHLIFRLLADVTFVGVTNTQFRIFYNACELLVGKAIAGFTEIPEADFIRALHTTRSKTDLLRVLVDTGMVKIKPGQRDRTIVFQEKLLKMARQFMDSSKLSREVVERHAHIYAGYILLFVLTKVAKLKDCEELDSLPYGRKPRTLWTTLMFLWSAAYRQERKFTSEDLRRSLAKRGIMSHVAESVARKLQMIDGKTTQSLIENAEMEDGDLRFTFHPYALGEMERIRELSRTRDRGDSR